MAAILDFDKYAIPHILACRIELRRRFSRKVKTVDKINIFCAGRLEKIETLQFCTETISMQSYTNPQIEKNNFLPLLLAIFIICYLYRIPHIFRGLGRLDDKLV